MAKCKILISALVQVTAWCAQSKLTKILDTLLPKYQAWMSVSRCPLCLTFDREGTVSCTGCRSIRRIRDIFCGGFLLRSQEGRAVEALRSCVGALTDLAEVAAPELEKEKRESGPAEAPIVVGNAAGPLGVPRAPVVGRLIEADKEAAEIVKTEEDEKKEEEATPGVRELKAEETGSENKEGGEVADEPKKKKKRRHKTQGSGQKDQNRKKKEKKEKEVK